MSDLTSDDLTSTVLTWHAGWALVRGYAAAAAADGVVTTQVHDQHREVELLVPDADTDRRRLDRACQQVLAIRGAWLSAATRDAARLADQVVEHGLRVLAPSECLMRRPLAGHPAPRAAAAYDLEVATEPGALRARIASDDEPAASGQAGVVGSTVVLDRILTEPGHRRRGLGAAVVGALCAAAEASGATDGLLVASSEGRLLYEALGWERAADLVVATQPQP